MWLEEHFYQQLPSTIVNRYSNEEKASAPFSYLEIDVQSRMFTVKASY